MGFSGEYTNSIDAKGRIVIPAKLREQLTEGFVVTKGLNNSAFILPKASFDRMEGELSSRSFTDKNARKLQLFFIGSKIDGEFDGQGRILLSKSIIEYARLAKDVVILGAGSRIEIWDKQTYKEFMDSVSDSEEFLDGISAFDL